MSISLVSQFTGSIDQFDFQLLFQRKQNAIDINLTNIDTKQSFSIQTLRFPNPFQTSSCLFTLTDNILNFTKCSPTPLDERSVPTSLQVERHNIHTLMPQHNQTNINKTNNSSWCSRIQSKGNSQYIFIHKVIDGEEYRFPFIEKKSVVSLIVNDQEQNTNDSTQTALFERFQALKTQLIQINFLNKLSRSVESDLKVLYSVDTEWPVSLDSFGIFPTKDQNCSIYDQDLLLSTQSVSNQKPIIQIDLYQESKHNSIYNNIPNSMSSLIPPLKHHKTFKPKHYVLLIGSVSDKTLLVLTGNRCQIIRKDSFKLLYKFSVTTASSPSNTTLSADNQILVLAEPARGILYLYEIKDGTLVASSNCVGENQISCLAMAPCITLIAVGTKQSGLHLYQRGKSDKLHFLLKINMFSECVCLCFSQNGSELYVGSESGTLTVINMENATPIYTASIKNRCIYKILSRGKFLYLCTSGGTIFKFCLSSRSIVTTYKGFTNNVYSVCIYGRYLVGSSVDIRVFDEPSGQFLQVLSDHNPSKLIKNLFYDSISQKLYSGSNELRSWVSER